MHEDQNLYLEYFKPGTTYHDKVRLYEEYIVKDSGLSYEERREILIDYQFALFEIGRYHRFLSKVDAVIEQVIEENIYYHNGVDVFHELLFKKTACLYNVGKYEEAIIILKQLIRISPQNKLSSQLLFKCYRKMRHESFDLIRISSVIILLISASLILAEIIVIKPHYSSLIQMFHTCFVISLASGLTLYLGNEMWHLYQRAKL